MKSSASRNRHEPLSKMYIRMVLPAEQTTAIAKSMLDRQSKPKGTWIDLELQRMKEASKKRKGKVLSAGVIGNKGNKKPRKVAPSRQKTPRQTSEKSENIVTIGQV